MNKFQIGQKASLEKTFTDEDVKTFARISLDSNPVHLNDEYAESTIFKGRIVHGFLSGSLISAVIGTILPGEGTIYLNQTMNFRKPVRIGENIKATVEIIGIKEEKNILTLNTYCENELGEIVIEGSAVVKV